MNNLLTALFLKMAVGSTINTDVSGRIYFDEAPQGSVFPYVVVSIISGVPDNTFAEDLDDILVQFSLFSTSKSVTEIANMYADLRAVLDDTTMSITANTFISCIRQNLVTMVEDITTLEGTGTIKHWIVDYLIKIQD